MTKNILAIVGILAFAIPWAFNQWSEAQLKQQLFQARQKVLSQDNGAWLYFRLTGSRNNDNN